MQRLHIHIAVNELSESINFYSILFNTKPTIEREDYAKWELTEPAVHFAISDRGHESGINHLGLQVDSEGELEEIAKRLDKAEIMATKQEGSSCCYAHSNKHWVLDPQGIAWESFHTLGEAAIFCEDTKIDSNSEASARCIPSSLDQSADSDDVRGCCS